MSSQRLLLFHLSCQLQVLDRFDQVLFAKLSAARSTLFLEKAESQEDLSQRAAGWPVPSTRPRAGLAPQKADHGLSLSLPPPFPLNHNLLQLATRTSVTLLKGGSTFRTDPSLVRRPVRAQQPDDLPPLTLRCLSRPPARFSLDATHPSPPSFFPTRISVSFASHLSALLDALLTFLFPSSLSDVPTFTSHVVALAKIGMYPVIAGYV